MKYKAAAIQMSSLIEDHSGNIERAKELVRTATKEGAKLCVLPELVLDEFFAQWQDAKRFERAESLDGRTVREFQTLARETNCYLILPLFERGIMGNCFNSAVLISNEGSIVGVYRKNHIPFSRTYEKYYFTPGNGFPVFDTPLGKIGILICYDRRFPESFRELVKKGAEIVCIPIASWTIKDSGQSELPFWEAELRVRALENQIYIVAANKSGEEENLVFIGNSMIVAPNGEVLSKTDDAENTLVLAELDTTVVRTTRNRSPLYRDRRTDIYG